MAKKHTKILKLTGKRCRLGKVSNNLERHGEKFVTAFSIPVRDLMLTKAELNAFLRDPGAHDSWYTKPKKGESIEPMPWWNGESFAHGEEYEADKAMITLGGDRELEFESTGDPKDDDYKPAMVISKIKLTPQVGGMTEVSCSIYVRPGVGKTNLSLQGAQHDEVQLTVAAAVSDREKSQPQLPLNEGDDTGEAKGNGDTPAAASASTH